MNGTAQKTDDGYLVEFENGHTWEPDVDSLESYLSPADLKDLEQFGLVEFGSN